MALRFLADIKPMKHGTERGGECSSSRRAKTKASVPKEIRERPNMNLQAEPLHLKEATVTCIPRLRGGSGGRRSRRGAAATQVSMLDRVRDVVLRLAMLSATSTAATTTTKCGGAPGTLRRAATSVTATPSRAAARVSPAASVAYTDSYRSEAVDDCIEFLKRSAAGGGGAPATTAVEASAAAAASPLHAAAACAM